MSGRNSLLRCSRNPKTAGVQNFFLRPLPGSVAPRWERQELDRGVIDLGSPGPMDRGVEGAKAFLALFEPLTTVFLAHSEALHRAAKNNTTSNMDGAFLMHRRPENTRSRYLNLIRIAQDLQGPGAEQATDSGGFRCVSYPPSSGPRAKWILFGVRLLGNLVRLLPRACRSDLCTSFPSSFLLPSSRSPIFPGSSNGRGGKSGFNWPIQRTVAGFRGS